MSQTSILEKYWKVFVGAFVVIVVAGVAYGVGENMSKKKESQAQESFFPIEKKYFEAKTKAAAPAEKKEAPTDWAALKADFGKVISQFPQSKAAQMSSIYLAEILLSENNPTEALATLQKTSGQGKGLIGALINNQMGRTLADQEKCQEAIQVWDKVIQSTDVMFLHSEARLQQALCYRKLNDSKRAEDILNGLVSQKGELNQEEAAISKEAEKYLRLIRFAKLSGS